MFTDVRSGKNMERRGLAVLLSFAGKGDTLAVVRLERLGGSLTELLMSVETLKTRGIALLSLEENIVACFTEQWLRWPLFDTSFW